MFGMKVGKKRGPDIRRRGSIGGGAGDCGGFSTFSASYGVDSGDGKVVSVAGKSEEFNGGIAIGAVNCNGGEPRQRGHG